MKNISILILALFLFSCKDKNHSNLKLSKIKKWQLSWRMVASSIDENYSLGEKQFDSLLVDKNKNETFFLTTGLEILYKLNKKKKIQSILNNLNDLELSDLCNRDLFTQKLKDFGKCKSVKKIIVDNPVLQQELIKMFVNDQAERGNILEDIINKYKLDKTQLLQNNGENVDEYNRTRLKKIFKEHGFPTKNLVGRDAMYGIFLMIQHADNDKEWQKSQLKNIETAIKNQDLDRQYFAYLYDRININAGEKQLYGTQFSMANKENIVELSPTEDLKNLNSRRMQIGLMPIEMYKKLMLKETKKH